MPTETPDLLDRLQAVDPAAGDDRAPAWEDTRRRIVTTPRRTAGWRPRRAFALGGAVAALAVTASFVYDSGPAPPDGRPRLGVLEAAAATAASNPRFSGYTAETRLEILAAPEIEGHVDLSWTIVRPVSETEYEARMESLRPVPEQPIEPPPGSAIPELPGVKRTERREGDQIRDITTWRQPYGTVFQGIPAFFRPGSTEGPVTVPTDPDAVAAAVAAWAAGRVPAGLHPEQADLIQEAGRSPIARALIYAGNVLTAPRVAPDVRAAVYRALSRVPAVKVDPTAKDAFGRPGAALIAEDSDGPSHTRSELLIDPKTSRILAERHVFTVDPGTNENRGKNDPPHAEGSQETTYRYDG
ncbi:hypothetical protein OJ997_05090 [Solirubrobacter phytolaccae]|uniref:CU044_5270 family protein n=1 Tax=Solirubrobacter phytolaccae TaxID=1404360 RepID=A0A9X3S7W9_9ACTN|nr:hypothetical protein [Solirubrobacter phytolaccae]MDA0179661.1 hypothetical protein [Solirubrobacter phytolaccae]